MQILRNTYKFIGCIIYTIDQDEKNVGHFTTIIKIQNRYFYFDDDTVSPLFFFKNCPSDTLEKIRFTSEGLQSRNVIMLYGHHIGAFNPDEYEEISINQFVPDLDENNPTNSINITLKRIAQDKQNSVETVSTNTISLSQSNEKKFPSNSDSSDSEYDNSNQIEKAAKINERPKIFFFNSSKISSN